jgi:hypothetical protein
MSRSRDYQSLVEAALRSRDRQRQERLAHDAVAGVGHGAKARTPRKGPAAPFEISQLRADLESLRAELATLRALIRPSNGRSRKSNPV